MTGEELKRHMQSVLPLDSLHQIAKDYKVVPGYASIARLANCESHDVRYVMRLKDNWKPKVDRLVRGAISDAVIDSDDFDVLLEEDVVRLDGRVIDADVTLGRGAQKIQSRMVGIHTPKGYCFFVTNVPRATHGPNQIGDLYRIRCKIEVDNKVDKAGARLDEISARKGVSVRILLLASLLNTTIARTIVQSEKRGASQRSRPVRPNGPPSAASHSADSCAGHVSWDSVAPAPGCCFDSGRVEFAPRQSAPSRA